jgi:DNA-binding beta-propeller fold protein YncE
MIDIETLRVTRRAEFPEGSRPWMLRASPDGRVLYVQTATGANVVLDAKTLETLHTEELGEQPVTTAWSPDGRYNFVTHFADDWVAVLEPRSGRLIKRLQVGQRGANVSFRPDGAYGYVAVTGKNVVAVVEMESLEVKRELEAGEEPMGLIVL